jgi:hypothetical protein
MAAAPFVRLRSDAMMMKRVVAVCLGMLLFGTTAIVVALTRPCNQNISTFSWTMASSKSSQQCAFMVAAGLIVHTVFSQVLVVTALVVALLRLAHERPRVGSAPAPFARAEPLSAPERARADELQRAGAAGPERQWLEYRRDLVFVDMFSLVRLPVDWYVKLHVGLVFAASYAAIGVSMFPAVEEWQPRSHLWHEVAVVLYTMTTWYTFGCAVALVQHVLRAEAAAWGGGDGHTVAAACASAAATVSPYALFLFGFLLVSDSLGAGVSKTSDDVTRNEYWVGYCGFFELLALLASFLAACLFAVPLVHCNLVVHLCGPAEGAGAGAGAGRAA